MKISMRKRIRLESRIAKSVAYNWHAVGEASRALLPGPQLCVHGLFFKKKDASLRFRNFDVTRRGFEKKEKQPTFYHAGVSHFCVWGEQTMLQACMRDYKSEVGKKILNNDCAFMQIRCERKALGITCRLSPTER